MKKIEEMGFNEKVEFILKRLAERASSEVKYIEEFLTDSQGPKFTREDMHKIFDELDKNKVGRRQKVETSIFIGLEKWASRHEKLWQKYREFFFMDILFLVTHFYELFDVFCFDYITDNLVIIFPSDQDIIEKLAKTYPKLGSIN